MTLIAGFHNSIPMKKERQETLQVNDSLTVVPQSSIFSINLSVLI